MSKETLKTSNFLIRLEDVAKSYRHKSASENKEPTERIQIDWEKISPEIIKMVDVENPNTYYYSIDSRLKVIVCITPHEYRLTIDESGILISTLQWFINDDFAELKHRLTPAQFRGQNLASELLHIGEAIIKKKAEKSEMNYVSTASAAQIDVWGWFLKNGYNVSKKDQPKFDELLKDLESETPTYQHNHGGYFREVQGALAQRFNFEKIINSENQAEKFAKVIKQKTKKIPDKSEI